MTEPTDFEADDAVPLPGLGDPAPAEGVVQRAARRTIAAQANELLTEKHAVACEMMLGLAARIDRAILDPRGKDYALANLSAQLLAWYVVIVPEEAEGGGHSDAFDQLAEDLRRAAARGYAAEFEPAD